MTYTPGQCTAYARSKCPWIPDDLGDARTWSLFASLRGFSVSHLPEVGTIAQWPARFAGAAEDGHVAVVTAVNGDGSVTVSEENWQGAGVIDTRTLRALVADGLYYIAPRRSPCPIPATGVAMTPDERLEVGRTFADLAYWALGHRAPEALAVRDAWAQLGVSGGFPQMLEAMANSAEFTANQRADYKRDHPPTENPAA